MSFLLGPISGAVAAGGVYYGFTTMIRTRTEQHLHDLRVLSNRLEEPNAGIHAPRSAFDRIQHRPFSVMVKSQWNTQVESLFHNVGDLSQQAAEWSRRKLYGESDGASK